MGLRYVKNTKQKIPHREGEKIWVRYIYRAHDLIVVIVATEDNKPRLKIASLLLLSFNRSAREIRIRICEDGGVFRGGPWMTEMVFLPFHYPLIIISLTGLDARAQDVVLYTVSTWASGGFCRPTSRRAVENNTLTAVPDPGLP
jgi:hypothetical protein